MNSPNPRARPDCSVYSSPPDIFNVNPFSAGLHDIFLRYRYLSYASLSKVAEIYLIIVFLHLLRSVSILISPHHACS